MYRLKYLYVLLALFMVARAFTTSEKRLIRIGMSGAFAAFYYHDVDGKLRVTSYKIGQALTDSPGYTVETERFPNMRSVLDKMGKLSVDLIVNLTSTDQRAGVALVASTARLIETQDLMVRADMPRISLAALFYLAAGRRNPISQLDHGDLR